MVKEGDLELPITGVLIRTGNVASHTAKAAEDEGLAQAFTYEADE